jgi:hypothetical protein
LGIKLHRNIQYGNLDSKVFHYVSVCFLETKPEQPKYLSLLQVSKWKHSLAALSAITHCSVAQCLMTSPIDHIKMLLVCVCFLHNSNPIFKIIYISQRTLINKYLKWLLCEKNGMMNINDPCQHEAHSLIKLWKACIAFTRVGFEDVFACTEYISWSFGPLFLQLHV